MQFSYPRPVHLLLREGAPKDAALISPEKKKILFSERVVVEEKMEGRLRMHKSGHFVLFSEDLQVRRAIAYSLSGRFAVLDVLDTRSNKFLNFEERARLLFDFFKNPRHLPQEYRDSGVFVVPVLATGKFSEAGLLGAPFPKSEFAMDGNPAGIVLKRVRETTPEEYISAQLVSPGFYQNGYDPKVVGFNRITPPPWFVEEMKYL